MADEPKKNPAQPPEPDASPPEKTYTAAEYNALQVQLQQAQDASPEADQGRQRRQADTGERPRHRTGSRACQGEAGRCGAGGTAESRSTGHRLSGVQAARHGRRGSGRQGQTDRLGHHAGNAEIPVSDAVRSGREKADTGTEAAGQSPAAAHPHRAQREAGHRGLLPPGVGNMVIKTG